MSIGVAVNNLPNIFILIEQKLLFWLFFEQIYVRRLKVVLNYWAMCINGEFSAVIWCND